MRALPLTALWAFLVRDARESRASSSAWLVEAGGILLTVLTFYFLGTWVDQRTTGALLAGTRSYFGFAVNGIAMATLLVQVVRGHSRALRLAQLSGTLEPLLLTPTPAWLIALGGALGEGVRGVVRLALYLGLAAAFGALTLGSRLFWLPLVLVVALLSFLPFGLLAASSTLLFKRGDPIAHLTNAATLLLGGVYFPPSVLPEWLAAASELYPATHAIAALRAVTLDGDFPGAALLRLALFTGFALPFTAWLVELSVQRARRHGTLGSL